MPESNPSPKKKSRKKPLPPVEPPPISPPAVTAPSPKFHERTVHFRRMIKATDKSLVTFDWRKALRKLDAGGIEARTVTDTNDNKVYLEIHKLNYPIRIILTTSREKAMPRLVDHSCNRRMIDFRDDEGVGEDTHIVIADVGILAVEFNNYGPRLKYLHQLLARSMGEGEMANIDFGTYVTPDAVIKLRNGEIFKASIRLPSSAIGDVKRADVELGSALESIQNRTDSDKIELIITKQRNDQTSDGLATGLPTFGLPSLFKIAESLKRYISFRPKLEVAIKPIDGGRAEILDLLNARIAPKIRFQLETERSKAIDTHHAFQSLETCYNQYSSQLNDAAIM